MSGTKPTYRVPTMKEIEAIPWNGYNVVSTFSGGGGSCLGYRMAGYHVLWANEFVEEAQKTYRANHPNTILDTRDIREIEAEDILKAINMKPGEIDLLDGSPPCCAFSTAGKRERGWNQERDYSEGKRQQIETLFYEYIRLIKGLQPKVFIAENVSGLVKGKAIGYFKEFLNCMKACGYKVKAQLLNAAWLGVPQSRERIIYIGVRNDLGLEPVYPEPMEYCYTIRDAFETLPPIDPEEEEELLAEVRGKKIGDVIAMLPKNPKKSISAASVMNGSWFNMKRESLDRPCSTICCSSGGMGTAGNFHPSVNRKFSIAELKRITSIPDDFILTGVRKQQWERLGRMVPPVMMMHISKTVQEQILDKVAKK